MKRTFLKTALAALFIAPFAFSSAFAACGADLSKTKTQCGSCKTDCCKYCGGKNHKCKKGCQCPCCHSEKDSGK